MNKIELIENCLKEQIKARDEQIHELNEEIQKLMAENSNMERTLEIKQNHILTEEIKRLNNIIDELEKFIDEEYRYYNKRNYPTFGACMGALSRVKDKLQELKGVDKE